MVDVGLKEMACHFGFIQWMENLNMDHFRLFLMRKKNIVDGVCDVEKG